MPKISVIITAHNYGRYVSQAVDSVLTQSFPDFELIIVNDGSSDNTDEVLEHYDNEPRVKVLKLDGVGLAKAANTGIRQSSGEYIVRLDADDYFDENILLVLNNVLDRHPEYGMVFPDYYRISKHGDIIDQVRQLKVNDEVKLLDRSALAAGALYRRSCFNELAGYNEELRYQEDYDYWIRFIDRFHVHNVRLPLMYYRQHNRSMSTNTGPRMQARRYVKQKFVKERRDQDGSNILGVLPITMENRYKRGLPLEELSGRPLMSYLAEEMKQVKGIDRLIVDTEDMEVAELAQSLGLEVPFIRPREFAGLDVVPEEHFRWLIGALKEHDGYEPDVLATVSYNHPLIRSDHIQEAIDTIFVYKCDSVISVTLDYKFHWKRGEQGLDPVTYPRNMLTDEKWAVFEERGGIAVFSAGNLKSKSFLGDRIGHIEIDEREGLRIESDFTFRMAEREIDKKPGNKLGQEAYLRMEVSPEADVSG